MSLIKVLSSIDIKTNPIQILEELCLLFHVHFHFSKSLGGVHFIGSNSRSVKE